MHMTNGRQRWRLPLATLALLSLLAGCQSPPKDRPLTSEVPEPPSFAAPPETCQAAAARFGLGLRANQQLLEEMRQRAGARAARTVLATDVADPAQDMMRLNVQVEPSGRVVGAYCG
ncbi:hypothetical protein SAMN05216567_101136 [Variovorax sp. OK605]|jgi:hypothetical protein|uniref:hypothetical protein n=1 Tax=unclassified Variovorax TaxID=663243 RepID=UPI0008B548A2|nr:MULTISPECIES: hypothetical protein [unclassified Variovorax]SEJ79322.1 hypothetical protein SAMN05518853_103600 [Variovorax sp. OK202]SFC92418.1 hypothetical protein SAMN05444746_103600 [Variovorax sp. OK212]SFO52985.1 hypothetical protein SAMN05216567_101136 [Variovorax sp. OK605]